ncbi:MAG: DUF4282 domain-containing protein [bacterium]
MGDFLTFRRFMTPVIIQVLFWVGVVGCIVGGVIYMVTEPGALSVAGGIGLIILGPIGVRIYCELMIIIFRINDNLVDIRNNTTKTL